MGQNCQSNKEGATANSCGVRGKKKHHGSDIIIWQFVKSIGNYVDMMLPSAIKKQIQKDAKPLFGLTSFI